MEELTGDLSLGIQKNPPVQRAVLAYQVVDIGAPGPDALEGHGLQDSLVDEFDRATSLSVPLPAGYPCSPSWRREM